jgi:hypothetical protein
VALTLGRHSLECSLSITYDQADRLPVAARVYCNSATIGDPLMSYFRQEILP